MIPISIERIGTASFIIRRFFRIYPLYAIGLLMVVASVFVYTSRVGTPFPYTPRDYLINASLLRDWFWIPSIDGVNWTLEVEIKFYLVCAFLTWFSNLRNPKTLLIPALVMMVFVYVTSGTYDFLLQNFAYLYRFTYIVSSAAVYLTFMFIGTCFYNLFIGHWTRHRFWMVTGALLLIFTVNIQYWPDQVLSKVVWVNYSYALILFCACYLLRERLPFSRALNFIADISYPIYIIHGVIGYILLTILVTHNVNYYVALVVTVGLIIGASYALHKVVEMPANRLGKYAAARLKRLFAAP